MPAPDLLLSGFCDEASVDKTLDQQFSVMAALGFSYASLRFLDAGWGVKNVIDLNTTELSAVRKKLTDYGLGVSSIGSPLGKVKLLDVDDGSTNRYISFTDYLRSEVDRTCQVAAELDCKLIRGFSFYRPRGSDPWDHVHLAIEQLGRIAERCQEYGLTLGLEVEANLVGHSGSLLKYIHEQIANPALVLVFDGANLVMQGYSQQQVIDQYRHMEPALGWLHVKDFRLAAARSTPVGDDLDEASVSGFVPAGLGDSGYPEILELLAAALPDIKRRMASRGVAGVFADLEPHLRTGGQFAGYSGADGFGIAARAFRELCAARRISLDLRDFDSLSDSSLKGTVSN